MTGPGFATIDFETTGLSAAGDRVVEVAVVHSAPDGSFTGAWDTLVQPGRPPGPTRIHRITAAMLEGAPVFAEIAPRLIELLAGRVVVAHNAGFDTRFLLAELARIGYSPAVPMVSLCTARLSRQFLPAGRRSLAHLCEVFAIDLTGAHRASVDAVATAELLEAYIANSPGRRGWQEVLDRAAAHPLRPLGQRAGARGWYPRERAGAGSTLPLPARPSFAPVPV